MTRFETVAADVIKLPASDRFKARDRVRKAIASIGRRLTACDRAVAEALLERINWKYGFCYPGASRLVFDTGFCRRQVLRSRLKLDDLGITVSQSVQHEPNRHGCKRVTFPTLVTSVSPPGDADVTTPGDMGVTPLVTPVSPKPIEENQLKTTTADATSRKQAAKGSEAHANAEFDRFWHAYPRKVAKAGAVTSWGKLSEAQRTLAIAAIPAFVAELKRDRTEERYIPHPATWLNKERFNDFASPSQFDEQQSAGDGQKYARNLARQFVASEQWERELGPRPGCQGSLVSAEMLAEAKASLTRPPPAEPPVVSRPQAQVVEIAEVHHAARR